MSGGGKGSNTTEVKLPEWYSKAAEQALKMSEVKAKMGYIPYMGPDVAAFSGQAKDGMQMANDFSSAFGMSPKRDIASELPPETNFGNGIKGYSGYPMYMDSMTQLKNTYPGLAKYLESFSIDPITGKMPQPNAWDDMTTITNPPRGNRRPTPGNNH